MRFPGAPFSLNLHRFANLKDLEAPPLWFLWMIHYLDKINTLALGMDSTSIPSPFFQKVSGWEWKSQPLLTLVSWQPVPNLRCFPKVTSINIKTDSFITLQHLGNAKGFESLSQNCGWKPKTCGNMIKMFLINHKVTYTWVFLVNLLGCAEFFESTNYIFLLIWENFQLSFLQNFILLHCLFSLWDFKYTYTNTYTHTHAHTHELLILFHWNLRLFFNVYFQMGDFLLAYFQVNSYLHSAIFYY